MLDLERLVREQDTQITLLKGTVADLQRRLGQVEGHRGQLGEEVTDVSWGEVKEVSWGRSHRLVGGEVTSHLEEGSQR